MIIFNSRCQTPMTLAAFNVLRTSFACTLDKRRADGRFWKRNLTRCAILYYSYVSWTIVEKWRVVLTTWLVGVVMVGVGSDSERIIGGGGRAACKALPLFLLLLDEPRCFQQRFQAHPDVADSLHDELCSSLRSFGRLRPCDRTVDSRRRLARTKKSRVRSRVSTLLFFCCCQPRVAICVRTKKKKPTILLYWKCTRPRCRCRREEWGGTE